MSERFKKKLENEPQIDISRRKFLRKTLEVSVGAAALTVSSGALGVIEKALAAGASESHEAVKIRHDAIKMMLHILGHLPSDPSQGSVDGQTLTEAVGAYQKKRGKGITGNIDDIDINVISMEVMSK